MTKSNIVYKSLTSSAPPQLSVGSAAAVLSIAILLCLLSFSQAENTIPTEGSDEERRIQSESSNKSLPPKRYEAKKDEEWYSSSWCKNAGGNDSVTLWDDTIPDCLLPDRVIEFDFGKGMKPYECVGQAIHYARMAGKKPECILIQRSDIPDKTFQKAVRKVQSAVISSEISLQCMNHEGTIVSCPSAIISGDFK